LDALRPTRFQREAAVSGLGSSKKETVLWLSRAKSSACHLHQSSAPLIEISLSQKLFLSPKRRGQLLEVISNISNTHEQEQNSAP
jgi:hypothetical protein